jgi:8-oxo-dGTP pyrophosphatase MutT (NUDIX family)
MEKTKKELSAGSIVFKKKGKKIFWLVVKPRESDEWCFPKSHLKGGENSVMAAKRGAKEKAGIETELLEKIGIDNYSLYQDKKRILKTVIFYLIEYLQNSEESFGKETEKVIWLPLKKALEKLALVKEKKFLRQAADLLKKIEK